MKKIKYLLIVIILVLSFNLKVEAEEYSTVLKESILDYEGNKDFDITISSNELPENTKLYMNGSSCNANFSHVDEKYKIYSNCDFNILLYTEAMHEPITDKEVEILISMDGLKEGTKYDVYYLSDTWPTIVDEDNLGEKATVVKIDGKLYIKLITSTLKRFVLEKEMSKEYKESLNKLMPTGVFEFPSLKPTRDGRDGFDYWSLFGIYEKFGIDDYEIWPVGELDLSKDYQFMTLKFNKLNETHVVKYKWANVPKHLVNKFNEIKETVLNNIAPLEKISPEDKGVYFEVEDLTIINYMLNTQDNKIKNNHSDIINYSNDLRKLLKNNNFKYHFDIRKGNGELFYNIGVGYMLLEYNNFIYAFDFDAGYYIKQVIYIPDDTKDTDEDYIKAASKRIKEYLGHDNFKIEVAGNRRSITDEYLNYNEIWTKFYDIDNISDNYYNLTVNDQTVEIVFEKNSKKIKDIEFTTKDLESDVEINSKSSKIPLDTLIEVDEITKEETKFKEILNKLNKDNGMIFDLKLHSETLNKYITKLENGYFEVRIPLKEEYKNKNLSAYYIKDNGEIEEYKITIKDGYGIFTTNHFSTYTIAESKSNNNNNSIQVNNPNTSDNIIKYIILGIISLISSLKIVFKYKENN